jgi:hypothetical protein
MADKPQEEASAAMRAIARLCRDQYVALMAEGFKEREALTIIGHTLAAIFKAQQ